MWKRLGLDAILEKVGLDAKTKCLTEVMTLNRLVAPASEHARPAWVRRTALAEILGTDLSWLNDEALYRNLDKLHPERVAIEAALADRERSLFQLGESIYLYDLTSTYFEGQGKKNPKARYGYSRDQRPDCKQVVVGLVLDGDGFPKAHEVFEGNRNDSTTVEQMLAALEKLAQRIAKKRLRAEGKVGEALGRLKQRYSRAVRYYQIVYDAEQQQLRWTELADKKHQAERLDGGYLLKTDRQDMSGQEIWRTYILLTRVESAFRSMKSPLLERPIFHQKEQRVEAHIFLCVLAYHLLVCVEKTFRDHGIFTSWESIREQLSNHQVVTVRLPASNGRVLTIRKAATPDREHKAIYQTLRIPETIVGPIKTWEST